VEHVSSLKTGVRYKATPIGKIPVDWEILSLSKISQINMGRSPPSKDCNERGVGLPFYQGNAAFGSKYPGPKTWCNLPEKIADEGDILISVRAPVGEIYVAPHKCCIGKGIAAVKAKGVHDEFLYQSMLMRRKTLQGLAKGHRFGAINLRELSELLIPLPPFSEQKKIGEILTTVAVAIEKTERIIDKTEQLKKFLTEEFIKKDKKTDMALKTSDSKIQKELRLKQLLHLLKQGLMQLLLTGKQRVAV